MARPVKKWTVRTGSFLGSLEDWLPGETPTPARKLGSHNKEDCTENNWTEATKEELHFDVRLRRFPTINAQRTSNLELTISIGKKGAPTIERQRKRKRKERMYKRANKLLHETK